MQVTVDELFKQGHLLVAGSHHVQTEHGHYLAVSHPLVVVGVYLVQQVLHLLFICQHPQAKHQLFKLLFVQNPVLVCVVTFKPPVELLQEPLVLFQLEVQNYLLEVSVQQLLGLGDILLHLLFSLFPGQPLARTF